MQGLAERGVTLVALGMLAYQVTSVLHPLHGAMEFYYFHLGLLMLLVSLHLAELAARRAARPPVAIWLGLGTVALLSVVSTGYLHLETSAIELRQPFISRIDFAAGAALVLAVIVLVHLVWGAILAGLIVLAILYFCFGDLLPGGLSHRPPMPEIIMSYLAGMGGARGVIWGIPLSANTLFLIVVFGGLMKGARILELFDEVGKLLLTVSRAGVAYSAILASSAIGMVTGQAVANIALSGSVTIPAMRQRGMSAEAASAVEVTASLGSQLLPPIMGLAAFLIAVNLGVPYAEIAAAAVLPALLFTASLFVMVGFLVAATPSMRVRGEPVERAKILWILPSFLIAFAALLTLLYMRYSPGYAAVWAGGLLLGLSFLRPARYRPTLRELIEGIVYGCVAAANLGLILAGIGIVIQVLVTTGAGFELGRIMMSASGGQVWAALLLGMALSLLVGLGLPTPAAYALIAIIMVPTLVNLGVGPLEAHFFGFYFAIFSAITPPVAVGVMAATRISGASFYGTVLHCARFALVPVLIPFSFVAFPELLAFPSVSVSTLVLCVLLLGVTAAWSASLFGVLFEPLTRAQRLLLLAGPAVYVGVLATQEVALGLPFLLAFGIWAYYRRRQYRAASESP